MSYLTNVIRENMIHAHEKLSKTAPDFTFINKDQSVRYESEFSLGILNRVLQYKRLTEIEKQIEEVSLIASTYSNRGVPCQWLTYSDDKDDVIITALTSNHFKKVGSATGMALTLKSWKSKQSNINGLIIKEIDSAEDIEIYKKVFFAGFQIPDEFQKAISQFCVDLGEEDSGYFQHYLAFLEKEPISILTTFHDREVAGIYNVATLEPYRKKGIGGAITAYAISKMQLKGAQFAILQSSALGESVYRKLGFEEKLKIDIYSL